MNFQHCTVDTEGQLRLNLMPAVLILHLGFSRQTLRFEGELQNSEQQIPGSPLCEPLIPLPPKGVDDKYTFQ